MKKNKYIWIFALIPFFYHILWLVNMEFKFSKKRLRKGVVIISFPRIGAINPNAFPIEIEGVYGDIFQPQIGDLDRRYDLIVLSATIDPIYSVDSLTEIWVSNMLVRSFFMFAFATGDTGLVKSGIRNLIVRMLRNNKRYVRYLLEEPIEQLRYTYKSQLPKLCEPYIAPIPKSSYLRRAGIYSYAILPLFDSKRIEFEEERRERLKYNLISSVNALLVDLKRLSDKEEYYYRVRNIAFPALAASELLPDSRYYLNYKQSFGSIVEAIEGTYPLPSQLQKLYLVAWDKWDYFFPKEGACAISGLKHVFYELNFVKNAIKFIGYSFLFIFLIVYLLAKYNNYSNYEKRYSEIISILVVSFFSILGNFVLIGEKLTAILINIFKQIGPLELILVEIILGILTVWIALKIANSNFKETKRYR